MHLTDNFATSAPVHQPVLRSAHSEGQSLGHAVPTVYIAAESSLRIRVEEELRGRGIEVSGYSAFNTVACRKSPCQPVCAVIDTDLLGIDVQISMGALAPKDYPPFILVGRCDDPRALVRAMKSGVFDFLPKPLGVTELLDAILLAMDQDRRQISRRLEEQVLRDRVNSLTPREREVLPLVVGGLLNKQAASLLGISEITLQIHRGQVMRKMRAGSLADLVRMCVKLRIRHWRQTA